MFEILLSWIANLLQVLGAVFALLAWLQAKRLEKLAQDEKERLTEKVNFNLVLKSNGRSIDLPLSIPRGDITRAEVLGYLGMVPTRNPGRYSLTWTARPEFLESLDLVKQGRARQIAILCSQEELEQFAI